jgi:hypothetical protein
VPGTRTKAHEDAQILKLAGEGLSQAEIARITGRSPHTIRRRLEGMGRGVYARAQLLGPRNPPKAWVKGTETSDRARDQVSLRVRSTCSASGATMGPGTYGHISPGPGRRSIIETQADSKEAPAQPSGSDSPS